MDGEELSGGPPAHGEIYSGSRGLIVPAFCVAVIPFGSTPTRKRVPDLNVNLCTRHVSLGVASFAGYAANSSFLGGIRASADDFQKCDGQSVIPVFLVVGDLNSAIIEHQAQNG